MEREQLDCGGEEAQDVYIRSVPNYKNSSESNELNDFHMLTKLQRQTVHSITSSWSMRPQPRLAYEPWYLEMMNPFPSFNAANHETVPKFSILVLWCCCGHTSFWNQSVLGLLSLLKLGHVQSYHDTLTNDLLRVVEKAL